VGRGGGGSHWERKEGEKKQNRKRPWNESQQLRVWESLRIKPITEPREIQGEKSEQKKERKGEKKVSLSYKGKLNRVKIGTEKKTKAYMLSRAEKSRNKEARGMRRSEGKKKGGPNVVCG